MTEETKKNNKKKVLLWLLLLISLVGGLGIYYWQKNQTSVPMISADLLPEVGDATDREIAEKAQEVADANYFTLTINPTAVFEDGTSEGSIEIINPATNVYPIAVDITLDDTGEVIYSSGAIYPNQQVLTAKLLKDLDKGEYDATATVNIYDPDSKEKQGVTEAEMKITVNN